MVAAWAREAGLMVPVGDPFFAESPTGQHLRLAFSYVHADKIQEGIRGLAEVVRDGLEEMA